MWFFEGFLKILWIFSGVYSNILCFTEMGFLKTERFIVLSKYLFFVHIDNFRHKDIMYLDVIYTAIEHFQ